jgi:hypothetical protein
MTLLYKLTVAVGLWSMWELLSIPVAETGDEPLAVPLSLYQALVFNPKMSDES